MTRLELANFIAETERRYQPVAIPRINELKADFIKAADDLKIWREFRLRKTSLQLGLQGACAHVGPCGPHCGDPPGRYAKARKALEDYVEAQAIASFYVDK